MTVDSRTEEAGSPAAPSIHVLRARKLLYGGLAGGAVAAGACLVGFGLGYGGRGLFSAALASAMVLVFYGVGTYVMVRCADLGARLLLSIALASYTTRVVLLGLILLVFARFGDRWPAVVPNVLFLTTVAVVVGWLVVEVVVFSRLRITAYDAGYTDPSDRDSAA